MRFTTSAEETIALWRAGNWTQLAVIFRPHIASAVRTYTLGDRDLQDDLIQEVLIRCWRYPEVPPRPYAFVRTVAINIGKDLRKTSFVRLRDTTEAGEAAIDNALDADDFAERLSVRESFRRAFRLLDAKDRNMLTLAIRDGRSITECAAALQTTEGATKMRLCRARRNLKAVWQLPHELLEGRTPRARPKATTQADHHPLQQRAAS